MIRLTRLNHVPVVLNSDLIEHVEVTPDTVISLTTGQKIVVLETADEVVERIVEFRRAVLGGTTGDTGQGNAMKKGPGGAQKAKGSAGPRDGEPPGAVVAELLPSLEHLTKELGSEIRAGKLQVVLQARGLVVSLSEAAFFPSGEDAIEPRTYDTIDKIVSAIRPLPNPVRLEGHTDNVPIHNSRFRSNWELSTARGIAMLELLTRRFSIPAARLAVAGYAEHVPAGPNDSDAGRAKNRRVDIVILNQRGVLREPPARAATPAAGK